MHVTPHRTRLIITSAAAASIAAGAHAAAADRWRRCKTIKRDAGPLVCHDELHAPPQRPGLGAGLPPAHGPGPS